MEREWQQVKQMKHMLFADQLSLLFSKKDGTSRNESMEQKVTGESWHFNCIIVLDATH